MTRSRGTRASLIVLNYEGREVIHSCLRSLQAAAADDDEIIVVDNASTAESRKLLEEIPRIRIVDLPTNTMIFGLNHGLAVAQGRYVAFLNNDITVPPDFVERCIERFADGDDVFGVCPRILDLSGADQGSRTAGYWSRGLLFYRVLPHANEPTDCFFAVGGQSFFRSDMLKEIGSIDTLLYPMYHEDVELSYRAWKRGWRIRYAPDAVVHHLGSHSSRKTFTPSQLRSFVRQNEYLTVWKDITDTSLLVEHCVLIIPRLLAALMKRDWPTLVGFARAFRRLPRALAARRRARAHMRLSDREVLAAVADP